jgi:hypothetical protein
MSDRHLYKHYQAYLGNMHHSELFAETLKNPLKNIADCYLHYEHG